MELEVDKKEFERIQQELIQATAENITLEYFEYEGKKWLNEDFVIPISVIQNKIDELSNNEEDYQYIISKTNRIIYKIDIIDILQELLEERNK